MQQLTVERLNDKKLSLNFNQGYSRKAWTILYLNWTTVDILSTNQTNISFFRDRQHERETVTICVLLWQPLTHQQKTFFFA